LYHCQLKLGLLVTPLQLHLKLHTAGHISKNPLQGKSTSKIGKHPSTCQYPANSRLRTEHIVVELQGKGKCTSLPIRLIGSLAVERFLLRLLASCRSILTNAARSISCFSSLLKSDFPPPESDVATPLTPTRAAMAALASACAPDLSIVDASPSRLTDGLYVYVYQTKNRKPSRLGFETAKSV
jgi:hypothetical protein